MLNISPHSINEKMKGVSLKSLQFVNGRNSGNVLLKLMIAFSVVGFIFLFIPWTQNIQGGGLVTTLRPDQRPQTIHSIIAGRIEKWHVKEGDFVNMGDTILFISEIKDAYFDPNLLDRISDQIKAKEMSALSYGSKVQALNNQIQALLETNKLKFEQAQNRVLQVKFKIASDSIDYEAAKINLEIAKEQYQRMEKLHAEGLRSLTDLETRNLNLQKVNAEKIAAENKYLSSRNELINAKVELSSIQAQYRDAISKAESERYTALSGKFDTEAMVTKLQNEYTNYSVRTGMYYITAPQTGYIARMIYSGIGETIKEGDQILTIMPAEYDLAVEMYIKPIDLPLIEIGQKVRVQFDGWPAIVFSGWPNTSYGTYGGKVFAYDKFTSTNGLYRVLVSPDPDDVPWPEPLRVGAGTRNILLLKDVPIWYEMWRQLNGFPPDYYKSYMKENI
jgi:membrane fusion protein, adhesin transport system